MKINPFANVLPFSNAVRSQRNNGDGGNARQQYDPNQNRKDDGQKKQDQPVPFDQQKVDEALASFRADATTQAHGLSASVEGTGPGLKIAIKDCNGTTLRQFSGDEFVRLREGTVQGARSRGKILDQKL